MLTTVIAIYTLYVILKLYVSVMQVGYINQHKRQDALLMSAGEYMKAGNYAVAKEKLSMASTLIEYVLFIVWMGGGIAWLSNTSMAFDGAMQTIIAVIGFILINAIVTFPMEWYSKFVLDEKFGFNRSSYAQYFKDTAITLVLTVVIGALIVWGIYAIIISTELWWLWSFGFIFGVIILINMFFPTIRALFFDKLTPLEDEELDKEIGRLMDETGFVSSGVFVSDASKRDAKLNAYFGGLGKTKRVVLFDTLLEKLSHKELLAVLGHELGHFAHGDIYKNIAMVGGMLFVMFAIFGNLSDSLYLEMGVASSPYVLMIIFMLLMPVISFAIMPIMGVMSRHNEYEADKTGAELGGGEHLVSALKKLVTENKSFPLSHPLYIFFYYTHPPVIERFKELGVDIYAQEEEHEVDSLGGLWPTQK
ncbi:MAG: M48 family metallopeptidase [Campylobacterota bacterium]|nr:M48 family metallopeptidase [Campylobacterota bacterium]